MNKSLSAYIKKYKLISWRDCDQILEELSNISFEPHHFINYAGTYEPADGDPLMYNSKDGQLSNEIYLTIMQSYFDCLLSFFMIGIFFLRMISGKISFGRFTIYPDLP